MRKISAVTIIIVAAIGLVLTYTAAGLISIQQATSAVSHEVPSSGSIATLNVGVYADYACSQKLESLNWGDIVPGGSVTKTLYIKNTGTASIKLSMQKTNWTPSAADGPITLTWDKENANLAPGQVATATLTLTVAEDIANITTFGVTILISGST